jgi:hypothetical protein
MASQEADHRCAINSGIRICSPGICDKGIHLALLPPQEP